jgi:glycosyltransferase involved in cell wall biosynthesis/GT2 family glycosyltransferase
MNPALIAQHPIYILAETIDDSTLRLGEGLPHVLMIDRQPFVEHYLERARVSVIPSCYDSGPSRNLLQILAAGTPAVCTTAGAEVLGLSDGQHVLVADEGKAFADAISTLLTDGALWRKLSRGVREHLMATHGGRTVQKRLHDLISRLCCAHPRLPIKIPLAATSSAPAPASQAAKRPNSEHEGPIRQLAEQHLPKHAKVMVISAGDPELLKVNGCTAWHFPQDENGSYAGRAPADSQVAIAQLERLRLKGGEFLLLPRASWWWLDQYAEFFSHLSKCYTEVRLEAGTAAIFDLREKKNTPKIAPPNTPRSGLAPRRVAIISGEPNTPGHDYRVAMYADALTSLGHEVVVTEYGEIKGILPLDCLVLWRTPWSDSLGKTVNSAREKGAKIVFDVDDLMFDPALAKIGIIDGIRSQGFEESVIAEFYRNMQRTVQAADFCTCTTKPLATALRRFEKTTFILPNGFDEIRYQASRRATADRLRNFGDGMIRLGYAGGSRTHQKDFSRLAPAIALLLREHPQCRLVLFERQDPSGRSPLVDVHEFPELAGLEGQIEWRRVVPARDLPNELARFDINLAPLEVGNVFCEAKSELKYFEAALVNVPTVASPTAPFAEAIQHERTGFLAASTGEWYDTIKRLVEDSNLRRLVGRAACLDVVWRYGPERRADLARTAYEQIFERESAAAARGFELELRRTTAPRRPLPECAGCDVIFETGSSTQSEVAVVVPLYNYAAYVVEALESARAQTLARKELIVVDDRSTDDSLRVAEAWMRKNATDFTRIVLLQNQSNAGLPRTRNTGFAFTDAPYVLPLDADNVLLPKCLETCLETIKRTGAAVAYATIRQFGEADHLVSLGQWTAGRFICGNYVDAMALIRRSAWAGVGGYKRMNVTGWEDYELWCRFIEEGLLGVWIPEVLTKYRVHHRSMLKTTTNIVENRNRLAAEMYALHPWLDACLLAGKR